MWLKKGECLTSLGRIEEAASAYSRVVNLAPNHLDARLVLASLHQQLGRPNQALDVLSGKSLKADEKSLLHFNAIVVSVGSSCKTEGKFVYLGCADTIVRNWTLLAGHSSPN